ncbi:ImmA/IrrE family metallo-endopeptidase [Streptococcus azizii]|uniref:ImmA/IrrE family metallo-endopeptidase n=1 Tax=Streptococcus azizii TaxID=1579424 RepID=A0AB36JJZ9_9STRE|nr:ImmA/IrrE family metallo-endopeptidase [Streptococcus azizii]ONK25699.1 ImmA/IrrE family metallo-endopeptidase [Streptococcus azizii]
MTEQDIIASFGIVVRYFDGDLMPDELGFYDKTTRTAFLSDRLSEKEKVKVLLHELGHENHSISEYHFARIKCENEADRNMVHHLVKDAIQQLDDIKDFNYLHFMEYYNLTTTTAEIMVKEEFYGILEEYL